MHLDQFQNVLVHPLHHLLFFCFVCGLGDLDARRCVLECARCHANKKETVIMVEVLALFP